MALREAHLEATLTPEEIEKLPWAPFGHGSTTKKLWGDPSGSSYAGLLRFEPGAGVEEHRHRHALHHIWVVEGSCEAGGRRLDPGSYAFVPVEAEHSISAVGADGCTLFYLYLSVAELD